MKELLPCPFCGEPALKTVQELDYGKAVCCSAYAACSVRGPARYSIDEAIKAWNEREYKEI